MGQTRNFQRKRQPSSGISVYRERYRENQPSRSNRNNTGRDRTVDKLGNPLRTVEAKRERNRRGVDRLGRPVERRPSRDRPRRDRFTSSEELAKILFKRAGRKPQEKTSAVPNETPAPKGPSFASQGRRELTPSEKIRRREEAEAVAGMYRATQGRRDPRG